MNVCTRSMYVICHVCTTYNILCTCHVSLTAFTLPTTIDLPTFDFTIVQFSWHPCKRFDKITVADHGNASLRPLPQPFGKQFDSFLGFQQCFRNYCTCTTVGQVRFIVPPLFRVQMGGQLRQVQLIRVFLLQSRHRYAHVPRFMQPFTWQCTHQWTWAVGPNGGFSSGDDVVGKERTQTRIDRTTERRGNDQLHFGHVLALLRLYVAAQRCDLFLALFGEGRVVYHGITDAQARAVEKGISSPFVVFGFAVTNKVDLFWHGLDGSGRLQETTWEHLQ